jgi:hypothetical protein
MKKLIMTMVMLLTLTTGVQAVQKPTTKKEAKELVDSANKDAIEVFSDTTSVDSAVIQLPADEDDEEMTRYPMSTFDRVIKKMDGKDVLGMLFVLGVLLIIFVLAPVMIIVALFYFITKNRREKMKLAQMAVQSGQPIPDQLLNEKVTDEFQKGLRQCFVGIGLMIFLGFTAGQVGFGVGALVTCIGLGKVVVGKMAEKNRE